jgi:hypothetical protein
MKNLQELRRANRAAALRTAVKDRQPLVIEAVDIEDFKAGDQQALDLPYLGYDVVEGWRLVDTFLSYRTEDLKWLYGVFGVVLSAPQYASAFRPGYGYGVILYMPLKCIVGVFERETVAEPSSTANEM